MKSHELNKIKDLEDRTEAMHQIVRESTEIKEPTKEFLYKLLNKESEERPTAREALVDDYFTFE